MKVRRDIINDELLKNESVDINNIVITSCIIEHPYEQGNIYKVQ